jgi:hypothetical protein
MNILNGYFTTGYIGYTSVLKLDTDIDNVRILINHPNSGGVYRSNVGVNLMTLLNPDLPITRRI